MANDSDRFGAGTSFNWAGSVRMEAGSYYAPKLKWSNPLGEDAHFIYSDAQTIGVADGVGGWAEHGVDSGVYARQLMTNAVQSIHESGAPVDPRKVLEEALLRTKEEGSSTACIITARDDFLHAVNVGDSGFLIFRGGKVIYKSPIQQYQFNFPFQLSAYSTDLSTAMEIKCALAPGDIIVAGTDGLFDNVHLGEIQQLVNKGLETKTMDMAQMARKIGYFALEKALDGSANTPFAEESRKAGNEKALGGKYDDITVVVAYIIPANLRGHLRTEDICPGIITSDDFAGSGRCKEPGTQDCRNLIS